MRYIKTFEYYGFPSSLTPVADYVSNLIEGKFDWWLNRKGIANFSNEYHLNMNDVITLDPDFPLQILTLKLSIVKDKLNSVSGNAAPLRTKRMLSGFEFYGHIYRGKIYSMLEIKIHVDTSAIEMDGIKKRIYQVVRHELHHLYKSYKTLIKGIDPKKDLYLTIFTNSILSLSFKYPKCKWFEDLIYTFYLFVDKSEFDAQMAMFSIPMNLKKEEIQGYKNMKKIINIDFESLYVMILKEFDRYYPNVDLDDLPQDFYDIYIEGLKNNGLSIKTHLIDEYIVDDFEIFIRKIYKFIEKYGKKFLNKSSKVFYTRSLKKDYNL
jgi:hypothetical protein